MGRVKVFNNIPDTACLYREVRVTDSAVGEHCVICDNSDLIRSSLGDRSTIGRRNLVINSSIGDGSYTGSNCEIRDCAIGKYCCISWNISLGGES